MVSRVISDGRYTGDAIKNTFILILKQFTRTINKKTPILVVSKLGITSKLNRRLTARNRWFWAVAIVLNNGNRPEPAVLGGQPPVEF